jgi:hypothetical protein
LRASDEQLSAYSQLQRKAARSDLCIDEKGGHSSPPFSCLGNEAGLTV